MASISLITLTIRYVIKENLIIILQEIINYNKIHKIIEQIY